MKKIILAALVALMVSGCRTDSDINDFTVNHYITPLEIYYFSAPAAGEIWRPHDIMKMKWTASDYTSAIDISIVKKKQYYELVIIKNIPNTGSYTWGIPTDIPYSSHYQIKITQSGRNVEVGYSDVFTIRE